MNVARTCRIEWHATGKQVSRLVHGSRQTMVRMGQGWEKRDWGGPRPTWRLVPSAMRRYPKGTSGPARYAVRVASRKAAKRLQFGAA